MNERKIKPIAAAVGAVFAAALAGAAVADSDSGLFAVEEIDRGYERLADAEGDEGSCGGEGSCGEEEEEEEKEGSCGEGSCGEDDGGSE